MRLVAFSSRCLYCRLFIIEHRVVIDHVELNGNEPHLPQYLLHLDAPEEAIEELARGTVAEHDLLLLGTAPPIENEQAFVHTVEQFDVLFV